MPLMEKSQLVSQLILFLKTDAACRSALECLTPKAEIAIQVAHSVEVSVKMKNGDIIAVEKPAVAPDFIFKATPAAIEVLIAEKDLSPAQLGIKLLKEVVANEIQIAMPGSLFQIPRKGYLNIIKVGGREFLRELGRYNLTSVPKIIEALRRLRRS